MGYQPVTPCSASTRKMVRRHGHLLSQARRGFGSIVNAGSVLCLLTPAGNLVAFEPSGKEFKQVATYKVAEGDTTAYPSWRGTRSL